MRRQVAAIEAAIKAKKSVPRFAVGDTVRVGFRVEEGDKTRVQHFEGVVISRRGTGVREAFTVRRVVFGEGVERVFPLYSPYLEGVEVVRQGKVRRSKLYYLRQTIGRNARVEERRGEAGETTEQAPSEPSAAAAAHPADRGS